MLVRAKILMVNTVSRRYRCAACHSLKFFAKIIYVSKRLEWAFSSVSSQPLLVTFYCVLAINGEAKFASAYNELRFTDNRQRSKILTDYRQKKLNFNRQPTSGSPYSDPLLKCFIVGFVLLLFNIFLLLF